jgi:hypothetical protein
MSSSSVAAARNDVSVPWSGNGILWTRIAARPAQGQSASGPLIHSAGPALIV